MIVCCAVELSDEVYPYYVRLIIWTKLLITPAVTSFIHETISFSRSLLNGGHQNGKKILCISGRIRPFRSYKKNINS